MKKFYCFLGLACVFGGINLHAQSTTVPTTFVNGDNDVFVLDTVIIYDESSSQRVVSQLEINTFNEINLLAGQVKKAFDPVWEVYASSSKQECEYGDAGNLMKEIFYNNVSPEKDEGGEDWSIYNYKEYYYGEENRLDSVKNYRNDGNGNYFNCDKMVYEYDGQGRNTLASNYVTWNPDMPLHLSSTREYADFDASGNPLNCKVSNYYEDVVTSATMERYTYDESGNMTLFETFTIGEDGTETLRTKTEFTYDENGNMVDEIFYSVDAYTAQFGPFFEYEFDYDSIEGYVTDYRYWVYNMDFTDSSLNESKEYRWRQVAIGSVSTAQADRASLTVRVDGNVVTLLYDGEVYSVALYDMQGALVGTLGEASDGCATFASDGLAAGVYVAFVLGNNGEKIAKFVIM